MTYVPIAGECPVCHRSNALDLAMLGSSKLVAKGVPPDELTKLRTDLAASQAREAQTRHEVELCYRMLLSEPDTKGALFKAENLLREALALPQDGSALREMIEAAKAEEREACAQVCEHFMDDAESEAGAVAAGFLQIAADTIRARKEK